MMQESKKILVVDDEPHNILLLRGYLTGMGHEVVGAENAIVALDALDRSFDLVLTDVMMPTMDGFEFVRAIRENPETDTIPIIMVTTLSEKEDRLRAVEAGANDFITKPVDQVELQVRVASMLRIKVQQDEITQFHMDLNSMVEQRTLELREALELVDKAYVETIFHLSAAAEYKDEETGAHIQRMSHTAALLAKKLGMSAGQVDLVLKCSPMHDIGKIGIPDAILLKPGGLAPDEWEVMKSHTTIGGEILSPGDSEYVKLGRTIAMSHHEKFDGSGYPAGLSGDGIPIEGRICAVADVFDALMSKRPYKAAFSLEKSLQIMKEGRGTHFDPDVLDAFLDCLDEVLAIKDRFQD